MCGGYGQFIQTIAGPCRDLVNLKSVQLTALIVNNDDFISRFRLLKFGREGVLNRLGNLWEANSPRSPYYYY